MTVDAEFQTATAALVSALQAAVVRLDGDGCADVDEAWDAYLTARLDALTAAGVPYPVMGQRGWVWLPDAEPSRTETKNWQCQARVGDPSGVAYRCGNDADCEDLGDGHQWVREGLAP